MVRRTTSESEPLLVPHRLPGPAVEATLLVRENRFLARCRLPSGEEVAAHVPDRGRLLEILKPGARVFLFPAAGPARRTQWSLLIAEDPRERVLVAIDPAGANARVKPLLEQGRLPVLGPGWQLQQEVRLGASRIDFMLRRGEERVAVEVKSVGVVRDGVAYFPDAPTERGVRHLAELEAFARTGKRSLLLFAAQRGDARAVSPDAEIDPAFAAALARARGRVELAAVCFDIRPEGCAYAGEIPVVLPGAKSIARSR